MSTNDTSKSPAGTQAIDRALAVLSSFVSQPEQGISDVAERTGLSPSTVHRIMRALVAARYLVQVPQNDRYRFGTAAVVLGRTARESLGFDVAKPLLEEVGLETGESVNMGVLDGHEVVIVVRVDSVQPLRFELPAGTRIKPHGCSMGKTLLAYSATDMVPQLELERLTPSTITTVSGLRAELDAIRQRGYAFDSEESIAGVTCVGAPVLDESNTAVAAVAVQAPTVRMTPARLAHLGKRLIEVGSEISHAMHLTAGAHN